MITISVDPKFTRFYLYYTEYFKVWNAMYSGAGVKWYRGEGATPEAAVEDLNRKVAADEYLRPSTTRFVPRPTPPPSVKNIDLSTLNFEL